MFNIEQLNVQYHHKDVLKNIHYTIPVTGNIVGIMGPNGAGKSTLIKAILGFVPSVGHCTLFGKPIQSQLDTIGYIPQKSQIDLDFPITVQNMIRLGGCTKKRFLKKTAQLRVEKVIQSLKLEDIKHRTLDTLSGGQLQRVIIARALVEDKAVYFLDEPFVGIDFLSQEIIINQLKQLKSQGKLIFIVHHDLESAKSLFDNIIWLNQTILKSGPVHNVFTDEWISNTYLGGAYSCHL